MSEEKKVLTEKMFEKALKKIGAQREDVEDYFYPVKRINAPGTETFEFESDAVCIMIKSPFGLTIPTLIFGLEED